jgi:iron complex outermembrane receptor protein
LEYEIEKLPGLIPSSVYDGNYTPNDAIGPETVPHFRGFLSTTWDFKGLSTDLKINYIGSYNEDPTGGTDYTTPIKEWTTFDLQVSYTFKRTGTRLTVGVENLFDKDPPLAISSFADNYDRGSHNILGRLVHVGIRQSF